MKTIYSILTAVVLLSVSCNKDDDKSPAQIIHDDTEILAVFAPSQLGDDGFSDQILYEIQNFNLDTDSSGIVTQFVASDSKEETFDAVQAWVQKPQSPFYGNTFDRRLLVLTAPELAECLPNIQLRDSDEVLLLNTSEKIIKDLDERYHVLNISVADEAMWFANGIVNLARMHNEQFNTAVEPQIYIFRISKNIEYPDSIEAGVIKGLAGLGTLTIYYLEDMLDNETASNEAVSKHRLNTLSYKFAEQFAQHSLDTQDKYLPGAIVCLGAFNRGFEYYLRNKFLYVAGLDVMMHYKIQRKYDAALHNWIAEWRQRPIGQMPKATWHCNGSQYSSEDFTRDIVFTYGEYPNFPIEYDDDDDDDATDTDE